MIPRIPSGLITRRKLRLGCLAIAVLALTIMVGRPSQGGTTPKADSIVESSFTQASDLSYGQVYALNSDPAFILKPIVPTLSPATLGVSSVDPTTLGPAAAPFGSIDLVEPWLGHLHARVWACGASSVQLSIDGVPRDWLPVGNEYRPDVEAAYPGCGRSGANLYFKLEGKYNAFSSLNAELSFVGYDGSIVSKWSGSAYLNHAFWSVDSRTIHADGTVTYNGWTIDPSHPRSVSGQVCYKVGCYGFTADAPRPDLLTIFPSSGPNHGFSLTVRAGGEIYFTDIDPEGTWRGDYQVIL